MRVKSLKNYAVALGLVAGMIGAVAAQSSQQDLCYLRNGVPISEEDAMTKCDTDIAAEYCYDAFQADCETPVGQVQGIWTE